MVYIDSSLFPSILSAKFVKSTSERRVKSILILLLDTEVEDSSGETKYKPGVERRSNSIDPRSESSGLPGKKELYVISSHLRLRSACLMTFSFRLQIVYDKDLFSLDDRMGDAEFDVRPFMEAVKMRLNNLPSGTVIRKIQPNRENCLSEESCIVWANGQVVQKMFLRLRNVESGEVELELKWIDIPGSRGL